MQLEVDGKLCLGMDAHTYEQTDGQPTNTISPAPPVGLVETTKIYVQQQ